LITLITGNTFDCMDTTFYLYEVRFNGLYVPNAFAPLSDNQGVKLFKPVGMNLKQYHVQVFNTWGELLWESTLLDSKGSPVEGWDGMHDNHLCPSGTYLWRIDALFEDGTIWEGSSNGTGQPGIFGTLTLIR
ncbi:MAG TPA: gliding motility-associated C-terminal domain-containing protein, partial [Bacteroidales bacterium]|nr:gliding motility-associated C-terminal domain-containing protein [Bacteroidales bacterium]HPS74677.1 gliding motility-associated C-terminal domain-containing protein [Bacteroidales bacterium]